MATATAAVHIGRCTVLRKITIFWSVVGIAGANALALTAACGDFPITTDPVYSPAPGNPYGGTTRNPGAYVPGSSPQPTLGSGNSGSTMNPSASPAAAGSAQHSTTSASESGATPGTMGGTSVRSTSFEITLDASTDTPNASPEM
ncbi:MAG: hypothetical protein FWD73_01025 [Polyangiaceae bacterium]|nr:hypothetical protein [Polyangiaceae bacterium]